MSFVEQSIPLMKDVAEITAEVPFLQYFFPLAAILGGGAFIFFGFKGLFFKSTIMLFKTRGYKSRVFTGNWAIVYGFVYLTVGLFMLFYLGGISYFIWF